MKNPEWIELTEEMILNYDALPDYMYKWRSYRVEYRDPETGFSNCEGRIYLPPRASPDDIEKLLNKYLNERKNTQ